MKVEPYNTVAGGSMIEGLDCVQHERGITRGGQDFTTGTVDPVPARQRWPEPFRAGYLIGLELARAKAQTPGQ